MFYTLYTHNLHNVHTRETERLHTFFSFCNPDFLMNSCVIESYAYVDKLFQPFMHKKHMTSEDFEEVCRGLPKGCTHETHPLMYERYHEWIVHFLGFHAWLSVRYHWFIHNKNLTQS